MSACYLFWVLKYISLNNIISNYRKINRQVLTSVIMMSTIDDQNSYSTKSGIV